MMTIDVLARRTRLCFLNAIAAKEAIPKVYFSYLFYFDPFYNFFPHPLPSSSFKKVADIMGRYLNWSEEERAKQISDAKNYLKTMGLSQDRSAYNHNQVNFSLFSFLSSFLFSIFYFVIS